MDVHELCDLLVTKTIEFIELAEQRHPDGYKFRDLKLEVEAVQAAIREKRLKKAHHK